MGQSWVVLGHESKISLPEFISLAVVPFFINEVCFEEEEKKID